MEEFYIHIFYSNLVDDNPDRKFDSDEETESELEHYIKNVMFYSAHFISLLNQLENAVELLTNFKYNSKKQISQGESLIYNVENYMIRIVSISDRLLQVINAVYYLKVDENKVNAKNILNHEKILPTEIPKLFKVLKKTLNEYLIDRNSVVHRHSYLSKETNRIEKLYHPILTKLYIEKNTKEEVKKFKYVRSMTLRAFSTKTKLKFKETNKTCKEQLLLIFDILSTEYQTIKKTLN